MARFILQYIIAGMIYVFLAVHVCPGANWDTRQINAHKIVVTVLIWPALLAQSFSETQVCQAQ